MKDINGDRSKSSSQDIISRDTDKKENIIISFCIRLHSSALIFYHQQRETRKWYNVVLVSDSEKHHVTNGKTEMNTKGKFLKIDDQG